MLIPNIENLYIYLSKKEYIYIYIGKHSFQLVPLVLSLKAKVFQ